MKKKYDEEKKIFLEEKQLEIKKRKTKTGTLKSILKEFE